MTPQERRDYNRAWYAANREKELIRAKAWRDQHHDSVDASQKKYREANRKKLNSARHKRRNSDLEKERARERAWYHRHREKALAKAKARNAAKPEVAKKWRADNHEKMNGYMKAWRSKNPEKYREQGRKDSSKRRARMLGAAIGDTAAIAIWESDWRRKRRVTCHWCGGRFAPKQCHSDHVMPLARGGAHNLDNLVVACARCNQRKYAKLPHEWSAQLVCPPLL